LDFYARGIHINRADNLACVSTALHHWPAHWFSNDEWAAAEIFWEVPFSTRPEILIERVLADKELYHRHLGFQLGPVTDSFSLLAFGRPSDFVLIFIRNDHFGEDDSDLPQWNRMGFGDSEPTHWLSVTVQRREFRHLCSEAQACLADLFSRHQSSRRP
jgi:hypothetical protein